MSLEHITTNYTRAEKQIRHVQFRCIKTARHQRRRENYINNCLQPVVDEIKNQRSTFGTDAIKLHHDNGKPHFHKDVLNYLELEGITVMPHPPHSPDLALCDFWLFDLIKQNLSDQDGSKSLHRVVNKFMKSLKKEEYKKIFAKWIQRMQLCVNNQGDYFEHLMK